MSNSPSISGEKILIPLLDALNWQGDRKKIDEIINFQQINDIETLIEVMAALNFRHNRVKKIKGSEMDVRSLPVMVATKNKCLLVVQISDDKALVYDGESGIYKQVELREIAGDAYVFQYADNLTDSLIQPQDKWFHKFIYRFRKLFLNLAFLTFLITLLDLMLPLFVILIYDRVLFAKSPEPLLVTLAGIAIYMIASYLLLGLRGKVLTYLSTRIGGIISLETFTRLMYLSPSYTESASVNSQISRIKDFENIKGFVSGGNLISLFDLVFSTVYIAAIFILGGWISIIPIITLLLLLFVGFIMRPFHKIKMAKVSEATSVKQQTLIEVLKYTNEIKSFGSSKHWLNRLKNIMSNQMMSQFELSNYTSITNNLSYLITNTSALVVIYLGVLQVFNGRMSTGALIGVLMLYWKVMSSIRTVFSLIVQVNGLLKSVAQINRFMKLPQDSLLKTSMTETKDIKGLVRFTDVSIRYNSDASPALLNVNFSNGPGQVLGITGHDGAGKTTILKLILGMYKPQGGRITIDNANIKQLEPLSLRKAISYSCEKDLIISGTIRDNFKCYNPAITDEQITGLIDRTGLCHTFTKYKFNLDSEIDDQKVQTLPPSFRKLLNLTRMLTRDSKLYLLDEPENHLDEESVKTVIEIIKELADFKGASVIISTNNNQILEACDNILTLNQGRVVARV